MAVYSVITLVLLASLVNIEARSVSQGKYFSRDILRRAIEDALEKVQRKSLLENPKHDERQEFNDKLDREIARLEDLVVKRKREGEQANKENIIGTADFSKVVSREENANVEVDNTIETLVDLLKRNLKGEDNDDSSISQRENNENAELETKRVMVDREVFAAKKKSATDQNEADKQIEKEVEIKKKEAVADQKETKADKKNVAKKETAVNIKEATTEDKVDKKEDQINNEITANSEKNSEKKETAGKSEKETVKKESAGKSEKEAVKKETTEKSENEAVKKESAGKSEKETAKEEDKEKKTTKEDAAEDSSKKEVKTAETKKQKDDEKSAKKESAVETESADESMCGGDKKECISKKEVKNEEVKDEVENENKKSEDVAVDDNDQVAEMSDVVSKKSTENAVAYKEEEERRKRRILNDLLDVLIERRNARKRERLETVLENVMALENYRRGYVNKNDVIEPYF